jgi:hypothetical protein
VWQSVADVPSEKSVPIIWERLPTNTEGGRQLLYKTTDYKPPTGANQEVSTSDVENVLLGGSNAKKTGLEISNRSSYCYPQQNDPSINQLIVSTCPNKPQ